MSKHLNDVKNKLSYINANVNVLDLLMEFERTMDMADVYAYRNWMEGEIVEGPKIDRYWVTVDFMYPKSLMPDPMGGMRLVKLGCKVTYKKDKFKVPVEIKGRSSYSNFSSKTPKIKNHDVWIISIRMPKRFMDERLLDGLQSDEAQDTFNIPTDDISAAYDADVDSGMDSGMDEEI
jgi:hypothetical protein